MKQIQYQQRAVKELVDKTIDLLTFSGKRHVLVFKAPTGAGKTVMASEMLLRVNAELRDRTDVPCKEVAYIWITQQAPRAELLQDALLLHRRTGVAPRHLRRPRPFRRRLYSSW